jgi:hypothetical protein
MKTKLIERYSGPCLCLIFGVCLFSCTVKNKVQIVPEVGKSNEKVGVWEVKVKLLPGFTIMELPEAGLPVMTASYNKNVVNYKGNQYSETVMFVYRFNNLGQCEEFVKQLTADGAVKIISVTSNTN